MNEACDSSPDGDEQAFMLRSLCYSKLGRYVEADRDADVVVNMDKYNIKGLINKAETLYMLGSFEHSLKFFHR